MRSRVCCTGDEKQDVLHWSWEAGHDVLHWSWEAGCVALVMRSRVCCTGDEKQDAKRCPCLIWMCSLLNANFTIFHLKKKVERGFFTTMVATVLSNSVNCLNYWVENRSEQLLAGRLILLEAVNLVHNISHIIIERLLTFLEGNHGRKHWGSWNHVGMDPAVLAYIWTWLQDLWHVYLMIIEPWCKDLTNL